MNIYGMFLLKHYRKKLSFLVYMHLKRQAAVAVGGITIYHKHSRKYKFLALLIL